MREARNVLKLPNIGVLILCEGGCAGRAKEEEFVYNKIKILTSLSIKVR